MPPSSSLEPEILPAKKEKLLQKHQQNKNCELLFMDVVKCFSFFPFSSLFAVINVIPYMIQKIYKALHNPSILATHFADLTYFEAMIQSNGNMGIINYYVHAVSIHYITIITSVCVFFSSALLVLSGENKKRNNERN